MAKAKLLNESASFLKKTGRKFYNIIPNNTSDDLKYDKETRKDEDRLAAVC